MTTPKRVTAIYSIDDDGRTWLVHLAEEERVHTFGRNFTKARAAIREAAALWFNVDDDGIEVLDLLPASYQEPLDELRTARAKLEQDQAEVVAKTADAVLMLRNWCGLPEREIAALTGISHQRVHQLLAEGELMATIEDRRVTVAENLGDVRVALSFGEPKTKAGRRVVPITPQLADRLTTRLAGMAPRDLLFTAPGRWSNEGEPVPPPHLAAGVHRRRARRHGADRPRRPRGPGPVRGLRIHDLRHTAVSWWIAAGADVKQIAVWAGHSSVATVLDRYGHLKKDLIRLDVHERQPNE